MYPNKPIKLEILEQCIKSHPGFIYIKDTSSKYILASNATADIAGFKSAADMIGKTDSDCPWHNFSEQFVKDDKHVIQNKVEHHSEYLIPVIYKNQALAVRTHKIPVFDDAEEVIAILGIVSSPDMSSIFTFLEGKNNSGNIIKYQLNLTDIEQEIIFLLTLGKSTYEIYDFMEFHRKQVSLPTINSIIRNNLFFKFNVHSISQLVKAALILKLNEIPPSFINIKKKIEELIHHTTNTNNNGIHIEEKSKLYNLVEGYNSYYLANLTKGKLAPEDLSSHIYSSLFEILISEGYELTSQESFNELYELEVTANKTDKYYQQQLLHLALKHTMLNVYKDPLKDYKLVTHDKDHIFDIIYKNRDINLSSIVTLKEDEFIYNRNTMLDTLMKNNIIIRLGV